MENGKDDQGEAHHGKIEEVGRPFVVGKVAVDAGGEFAEPENDTDGDEAEDGVEGGEEDLCRAVGTEGVVRDVLFREGGRGMGVGVVAVDFDVEADGQESKQNDEELLEADAAHVDMQTPFLGGDGIIAGRLAGTYDLDEEGYDVEDDEEAGQALRFDVPDHSVGEHEVHDSSQCHVGEGVDPERGEEDKELGDEGRAGFVFHGY